MAVAKSDSSDIDLATSRPFLGWLEEWVGNLQPLDIEEHLESRRVSPNEVGVISADLVEGFCYTGPLSSPRIANIVEPSANLFRRAYDLGVRQFALVQEYHTHDAPEFDQFGPHCIRGTTEANTVEALSSLSFADLFAVIHKNSLHPALDTDLDGWLAERPHLNTFIAVGDCTDLCLYQLVMHLKLGANALGRRIDVVVPAECVQTYDVSVEIAQSMGIMPHDGDLMHAVFLYHLALNGARVVQSLT